jgi:hypothetical protein
MRVRIPGFALLFVVSAKVLSSSQSTISSSNSSVADVVATRTARDQIAALSGVDREAAFDRLDALRIDPRDEGYPLRGRLRGTWSVRVRSGRHRRDVYR